MFISADAIDEYCRMAESTAQEALKRYCKAVLEVFGPDYLRLPTKTEIEKQITINKERGFPGMFGSLDCMSWAWKNCPKAWAGQFQGKDGHRNIVLEAVADQSLRIWHAYFDLPGSNNDINVVDRSPLVHNLLTGDLSAANYEVNGREYNRLYLLTDGIYPNWSVFVKTIHEPQGEKRCHFAKMQEAVRKDVERCFGVLQARFAIVSNPCRYWDQQQVKEIMLTCVVLHNMIVEDEQDDPTLNNEFLFEEVTLPEFRRDRTFGDLLTETTEIEDSRIHHQLRSDLIDHQRSPVNKRISECAA
ncbi:hypothetical protein R1sor_019182 [Riccia sorocarpa]|uniref:Transposase n=1 Tax=Riccia sorocarpa TaxID=122646 RepID=A0ABD3IBT7_9MARC